MTFGELQQLVSYNLDDLAFGYFTRDQVKMFLNNGLKETQKRLIQAGENYYLTRACTPMITNQGEYILPQDFMSTRRVELSQGTSPNNNLFLLKPLTLMEIATTNNQPGMPSAYYLKKNRLVLDRPLNGGTFELKLYYDYFVGNMANDNDEPDAPERYHEYIAILATIDCLIKDGREASLMMTKKNYYETLMKQDAERRTKDSPRMVVMSDSDAGWVF